MKGNLLDRLRHLWSIGEDHGWDPECVIAELCEGIEGDYVNSAEPGAAIAIFVNTFAKELKNRYIEIQLFLILCINLEASLQFPTFP